MFNFCTLFDSGYMNRGIAMYYSLKRHCNKFTLYILAFDDLCFETLNKMNLENVKLISLKEFENTELLRVKQERSRAEYCWTCSSSLVLYCMENYKLDICTYLDADIYFYNSPEIILNEIKNNSVLITKHNYTKEYDQSQTSGIYCVQFVTFRNDKNGMTVLKWWRDRCIEWCYARLEDGKFGDQKYLDDWPEKFEGVHVVKNPGAGIAPWNVQRYNFKVKNTEIYGCEKNTDLTFPVIFFHFHYIKFYTSKFIDCGNYLLSLNVKNTFYYDYLNDIINIRTALNNNYLIPNEVGYIDKFTSKTMPGIVNFFKNAVRRLKYKEHNVFHIYELYVFCFINKLKIFK